MIHRAEMGEMLMAEMKVGFNGCKWADRVRELMKYRDDHGHCNVPRTHLSDGG